jgi:TonB-dependent SusC/RagA subfamily outer membrane receptor
MKTRIFISILLVFSIPFTVNSQQSNSKDKKKLVIKGVVTRADKTPVTDAQIFVDGIYTKRGTDDLGNYKVNVNQDAKKIVAYSPKFGFSESDINGQNTINLTLDVKTANLPRFITESNIYLSGKKQKVKKINIYTDIYQMVRQEVPGVLVTGRSIVVQQPNSFLGSTTPLFVVDGQIVPSLDYINPQEVKSIRLLKGSEATIYGSEGANGVISVTLIKGGDK